MKIISFMCELASCQKVKGEVNHWFAAKITEGQDASVQIISFERFLRSVDGKPGSEDWQHFCGAQHLFEGISPKLPNS